MEAKQTNGAGGNATKRKPSISFADGVRAVLFIAATALSYFVYSYSTENLGLSKWSEIPVLLFVLVSAILIYGHRRCVVVLASFILGLQALAWVSVFFLMYDPFTIPAMFIFGIVLIAMLAPVILIGELAERILHKRTPWNPFVFSRERDFSLIIGATAAYIFFLVLPM